MKKIQNRNKAPTLKIEKILKQLLELNKGINSIVITSIDRNGMCHGFQVTRRSKLKWD